VKIAQRKRYNFMHFILTTLGCKVNQYESSGLYSELLRLGFKPVSGDKTADIFILNSCTVTENSDKKTRRLINAAKTKNPNVITVLTGCLPQAFPEAARVLGADIICGTSNRKELPEMINEFVKRRNIGETVERIMPHPLEYEDFPGFKPIGGRTRAFIKIQDGCDCNCAYCIVPAARGSPRSRPIHDVEAEARAAAKAGYKEIVLTGINLTRYKTSSSFTLSDAVQVVSKHVQRVRLSSVEPDLLSDNLLEALALAAGLAPHFHLSLQSGSDGVLARMCRNYTADDYYARIEKIRSLFGEDCAFTTDMIVGFPGETEQEFKESLDFAYKIGFSKIHVFPFSMRQGTSAALMENQIPEKIKLERRDSLMQAAAQMRQDFLTAQIGKTLSVLVEKRTTPNEVFGHAENYAPVKIISKTADSVNRNEILNVKITETRDGFCVGKY